LDKFGAGNTLLPNVKFTLDVILLLSPNTSLPKLIVVGVLCPVPKLIVVRPKHPRNELASITVTTEKFTDVKLLQFLNACPPINVKLVDDTESILMQSSNTDG